jgi:hypothetical protein
MSLLGAGSFGLVLKHENVATKYFYDITYGSYTNIVQEAQLQREAYAVLQGIVRVPYIFNVNNQIVTIDGVSYVSGIHMESVPIPEGFTNPVHMVLGYDQDDVDTVWARDCRQPVSSHNPPRGFHAGQEMMKAIWEDEGSSLTLDSVAFRMGQALSALIQNGFHPFDSEFLYGGNDQIWLIDYGLCRKTNMSHDTFFKNASSDGLFTSYYIPKKGMEGYEAFCRGYGFTG